MDRTGGRIAREHRTIEAMMSLYCRGTHGCRRGLCADCTELLAYALERLGKCPYGWRKPVCAKCPVHCYAPARRKRMRVVMRFAGPRMLLSHPVLALLHLLDARSKAPDKPGKRATPSSG